MSTNYCSNCGAKLAVSAGFCSECGTKIGESSANQQASVGQDESIETAGGGESDTMFKMTSGLVTGYFVFVVFGFGVSSNALIGLGVVCLFVSLITMYVDLRDLDGRLWDTRPILWVIGSALLYIVVAPLYIYKRQQVS
jgi:hypothetical protein